MKNLIVFPVLLILTFVVAPFVSAQEEYNPYAKMYLIRGNEDLLNGNYKNAIQNYTRVLRYDPDSPLIYTFRARAYFEMGDLENAIADTTRAIRNDRNNVSAYILRAKAHAKNGDINKAILDWEAVLRIEPDNTTARQNIELARAR